MRNNTTSWLVISIGLVLAACSDPCETLGERICSDLGADCDAWNSGVDQMLLPQPGAMRGRRALAAKLLKQRPEDEVCRNLGKAPNYGAYTLPQATYLVRLKKNPQAAGPAPKLPQLAMSSGYPSWLMYALGPVSILGIFGYSLVMKRRAAAGSGPPA